MTEMGTYLSYKPERSHVRQWVRKEREYADEKFETQKQQHDVEMEKDGIEDWSFWYNQIFQYVKRARILGLDTELGRQAMAKCYITMGGFLESMVRVYGRLPEGGVPSGELSAKDG